MLDNSHSGLDLNSGWLILRFMFGRLSKSCLPSEDMFGAHDLSLGQPDWPFENVRDNGDTRRRRDEGAPYASKRQATTATWRTSIISKWANGNHWKYKERTSGEKTTCYCGTKPLFARITLIHLWLVNIHTMQTKGRRSKLQASVGFVA